MSSTREEISVTPRLTVAEQVIGDVILKTWEANIVESKRTSKEIKEDCEEVFHLLNKESLGLGKDDSSEILGQINIVKHQLDIKESLEEAQTEISQLTQVGITQIDRWLVKTNLQLQSMISEDKMIEDRVPQLQKKLYLLKAKDVTEPSRLVVQFLSRCVECLERGKLST